MFSQAVQKREDPFNFGSLYDVEPDARITRDPSAPVLPKFLEPEVSHQSAQVLAFNSPTIVGAHIVSAKRDRDFQVIEAFIALSYTLPLDGRTRTRRVLASLRVDGTHGRTNLRDRLVAQAEEFFVLMVNAGRESMFPLIKTH